jgi:hypothetical protein
MALLRRQRREAAAQCVGDWIVRVDNSVPPAERGRDIAAAMSLPFGFKFDSG